MRKTKRSMLIVVLLMFLGALPAAAEAEIVTGEVQSVNLDARSMVIDRVDPETGVPQTVYLTSVLDQDIRGGDTLEDIEVGDIVSVQVGYYHEPMARSVRPAGSFEQSAKVETEIREDEGLLEDVGEADPSSLSIS